MDGELRRALEESRREYEIERVIAESRRDAIVDARSREVEESAFEEAVASSLADYHSHRQQQEQSRQRQDAELASELYLIDVMQQVDDDEALKAHADACMESAAAMRREERKHGSWDCPKCTFRSKPYANTCSACGQEVPEDKLAFSPLSPLRFGVELEIIVTNGIGDGYTCEWIACNLRKLGVNVRYLGYCHDTVDYWKLVTDASLRGTSRNDLCFELVSPILFGEPGLESMRSLLENVRKLGIATNSSCGFHVHVDASCNSMSTLPGLQRLVQCFVALENAFDLLVTLDTKALADGRRANQHRYCGSNLHAFGEMSNQQRWARVDFCSSIQQLVQLVNPNNDRYRKLNMTNLTAYSRPSTCEFRQHGGVEELLEAEAWVRLLLRFCDKASKRTQRSAKCLLREGASPKEELEALFQLVDCKGIEQFFLAERKLFSDNFLSNLWTCCVCGRQFQSSRSLSQHEAATGHRR